MMKTGDKGICRKCGLARESANHKKCDVWLSRASGWNHTANNETTTGNDLKRIAESIGDKPIGFSVKIVWFAE